MWPPRWRPFLTGDHPAPACSLLEAYRVVNGHIVLKAVL